MCAIMTCPLQAALGAGHVTEYGGPEASVPTTLATDVQLRYIAYCVLAVSPVTAISAKVSRIFQAHEAG